MRLVRLLAASLTLLIVLSLLGLSAASFSDQENLQLNLSMSTQASAQPAVGNLFQIDLVAPDANYQIKELVKDPTFTNKDRDWSRDGVVNYLENGQVQLGDPNNSGFVQDNCLTQQLELTFAVKNLGFYYKLNSIEQDPNFDQSALLVYIDENLVWQQKASLAHQDWQWGLINLALLDLGESAQFKICAGNSGDDQQSSYALLQKVTTKIAAVNSKEQLQVALADPLLADYFEVLGLPEALLGQNNQALEIIFNQDQPYNLIFKAWKNEQLIEEDELVVMADSQPPEPVTNLQIFEGSNSDLGQELNFEFAADQFFNYQLKYGQGDLSQSDWNDLTSFRIQSLPLISQTQLLYGFAKDFDPKQENFVLKSYDAAGNFSPISNQVSLSTQPNSADSIIINEIMANPEGSDSQLWLAGEWLELHNPTDQIIDLNNWQLVDAADNIITISPNNSDLNGNIEDAGETQLAPNQYLLVFNNGSSIFNNSGDTIRLVNQAGELQDERQYSRQTEGKTCGFISNQIWEKSLEPSPLQANF